MLTQSELATFKAQVYSPDSTSIICKRIREVWDKLTVLNDVYFDTHRDVDWSNSHTQHDKHEDYDREQQLLNFLCAKGSSLVRGDSFSPYIATLAYNCKIA